MHLQGEAPVGGNAVELLSERAEVHVLHTQAVDGAHQLDQRTSKAVDFPAWSNTKVNVMSEPHVSPNISVLLAHPSEQMSGGEVAQVKRDLLNACGLLSEAELYDTAAALGKRDPAAGHALLMEQAADPDFEAAFPMIRLALLVSFSARMDVIEAVPETRDLYVEVHAKTTAGGPTDRAREAAFHADPARFLPGAERSSVRLFRAPGFGMVCLDGTDIPWTYAAVGEVRSDYSELYALVEDGGYAGGVLVGPEAAANELALPDGYRFVVVELPVGGRAA